MRMRVRTALAVLIAVNVVWAAAFVGYARRSTTPLVKLQSDTKQPGAAPPQTSSSSNSAPSAISSSTSNSSPATNITKSPAIDPKSLASAGKKFGWQDVTNEAYVDYVARLRAVGAPEKQVRNIVVADLNDLFDQRRLEHAIKTDSQWWKAETFMGILPMQNFAGANFDDQRRELLTKILGEDESDSIKLTSLNSAAVNLTGPVLGALPPETWNSVQEICARSMDRHQAYQMARINENKPMDNLELAKLRDQTRTDLAKVLTPEQIEEFLLRYSHNSSKMRTDLRGIDLSPDEFRKLFRAIDPLEHRIQMDYGGPEALSAKQREQLEAQRDRAAREALTPEHFAQYMSTKDPLYKQAQLMAMQYGLNGKAVQPLHDMQKSLDARRVQITQDPAMPAEQKAQALQSISVEHQQKLQRILADTTYRQ
jgi:hypothetical protein